MMFLRYNDEISALSSVLHINTLHVMHRQSNMDYLLHCSQLPTQTQDQIAYLHSIQNGSIRVSSDGVYPVTDAVVEAIQH